MEVHGIGCCQKPCLSSWYVLLLAVKKQGSYFCYGIKNFLQLGTRDIGFFENLYPTLLPIKVTAYTECHSRELLKNCDKDAEV